MADENLAITGKDVKIELLLDGIPQQIVDEVVRFSSRARYQTVEVRHLGTCDVDIDKEPDGWEGELEVSRKTSQLDDFIDAYNLARRNRVPVLINIVETKYYRDATSSTHVYPDCKVEFSTEMSRGQATASRIPWVCGRDRI